MRLIDADALMALAHNHINRTVDCNDIARFPTVDAVPVVRCRDCRNRQNPEECPMCFTEVVDVVGGRMYKFTDLTHDGGYCHMGVEKNAAD